MMRHKWAIFCKKCSKFVGMDCLAIYALFLWKEWPLSIANLLVIWRGINLKGFIFLSTVMNLNEIQPNSNLHFLRHCPFNMLATPMNLLVNIRFLGAILIYWHRELFSALSEVCEMANIWPD